MEELAEDLFIEDSMVRFYGVRVPTRMAVVRLPQRRLLLYSPVFLSPALERELERLGRVAYLLSPNKIHNLTLEAYRVAYPDAELHVPPGLPERRPALPFDAVLGDGPPPAWAEELDQAWIGGNAFFCEVVLLHRRSRTLLVGDLVENFRSDSVSRTALLLGRLFGVPTRPAASPEFRFYTFDAAAAERSLARVCGWDFERIFLCHGRLIERDAKAVFEQVGQELLEHVRSRGRASRTLLGWLARLP